MGTTLSLLNRSIVMVINLKAANTSLFSKLFLNNMILILFWGANLNSVLIFHHIESSRLRTQFSEKIEMLLAEAAFKQSNRTLRVLKSRILMWMIAKSFGPLSELLIGRHSTFRPFLHHQTLLLRYLII